MSYLLDANVFIQAKNLHYGLDFCPAFWDWLVAQNAAGRVFSIDKVADEIAAGEPGGCWKGAPKPSPGQLTSRERAAQRAQRTTS